MRLDLAKTLRNFDLSLEQESKRWTIQRVHLLWLKPSLILRLTLAKRAEAAKAGRVSGEGSLPIFMLQMTSGRRVMRYNDDT
jgi:hypothetical protein